MLYFIPTEIDCEFAYSSENALVGHDAHSEEVDRRGVILSTHDLRRHVARRTGSILGVFPAPDARDAEVSDSQVPYTQSIAISLVV